MSAYITQLTGEQFTDPSRPFARTDPMATPGTLLLIDPTHPWGEWENRTGVPGRAGETTTNILPNLVERTARKLTGVASANTVHARHDFLTTGGGLFLERTAKGGLHAVMSNAVKPIPSNSYSFVRGLDAISAYLYANRAHKFYFSMWHRLTRAAPPTSPRDLLAGVMPYNVPSTYPTPPNYAAVFESNQMLPASAVAAGEAHATAVGDAAVRSIAWQNTLGSAYTNLDTVFLHSVGRAGTWPRYDAAATNADTHSSIFYRACIIDLTVAKMSYATARARDLDTANRAFSPNGGRFGGDTFTAPGTLP